MASLSLPRVLQLKKNSIDAERDQFERFQTLAVQKAINAHEIPVKEKHVRSTIIGTFQDQSAATYWMVALRQPLQDNRIVAWKFCHVTHKLLREGHPACLDDSQRHINMIENLGKLWVHLREGYGKLVHLYCKLLVCKIKFHARNPRFPGNMQLTSNELDAIAENDVNNYFQLCVELFDYMDDILTLQAAVFDSLGNARANSMTASGQCRLAALIPCAQDSSQIYDSNVRLLFRLHAALPADTLTGHRERFRQQFRKLSQFYKHASSLQYYRNLLTLPVLPTNPPNFLQQSDFGTYVTPVVSIPNQPPDEPDAVGSLVDTSDFMSQASTPEHTDLMDPPPPPQSYPHPMPRSDPLPPPQPYPAPQPYPQPDQLMERDRLIEHLQNELKRMRTETSQMMNERNTVLASMREHCTRVETQLQVAKYELEEEKVKCDSLSAQTPEMAQKLMVVEEKAKVQDDKFQKLKGAYTQLREEHINLIRQKAEVDKTAASLRATAAEHESSKMALQQQLNDRMKDVELLQQSASSSEEIDSYKNEIATLRSDLEQSRLKETQLETLRASMEALEIEHKAATIESQEKLSMIENELKDVTETLESLKQEKDEKDNELSRVREELVGLREKSGDEYKKVVAEKETLLQEMTMLREQYNQEKQEQEKCISDLKADLENLELKLLTTIREKDEDILGRDKANSELISTYESRKRDLEDKIKDQKHEINLLQEKFNIVTDSKDEVFSNMKNIMTEKDEKVIAINVEMLKLKDDVERLEDELNERNAELEIANNEIFSMREEYESIATSNDNNIVLKNRELGELHEKVNKLTLENSMILSEKESLANEMAKEKEEHECKVKNITDELEQLKDEYNAYKMEKEEETSKISEEISRLNDELERSKFEKETEMNKITVDVEEKESSFNARIAEKVYLISQAERNLEDLRLEYDEKEKDSKRHIEELLQTVAEKDEQNKDLLQHNTSLEESVVALKRQLEETKQELEEQRVSTVRCAGETALEVMRSALASLERANPQESNRTAAERAASALADLANNTHVQGNEADIAKSAMLVAHNTATLSSYVTELSNTSTNTDLSDKLTGECRSMLNTTKQCMEALKLGSVDVDSMNEAQKHVESLLKSAATADNMSSGNRSVDDELSDMDRAIEEAAGRIEEMLVASRAADSGVKLEVNGKILDACTTLMAAVKILVQDARKLQNELGDPKTRQKMYRRNPQWSEGLISAAKAVVFAAKLLVTSADEAVGSAGRVEGVSAAAHEVAGSTAQLVAASRSRAPPASPALASLTHASRSVAAATGAVVAAVRAAAALVTDQDALDTSALTLTATRRLEMESKVRSLELESQLDNERLKLAALRKRHYQLAQLEENGNMTNGK